MFSILWKRITDLHQPSHILKSLLLSEYLLIHGDDRFVRDMRTKKNVVKRLTGYKFYRNHEDVGGEVRNQARTVLELLVNEDALEKMRKDRDSGVANTKADRYERSYGNQLKLNDEYSESSQLDSPQQKPLRLKEPSMSFNNSSLDSPTGFGGFISLHNALRTERANR
ncbi:hypothetical protein BVRB_032960 [Beta vulgaris subsp. vulgaris]|uniref:ENTH domain-containing protein n=1 Tax=Beta vulgaris subsp. vulgaris TaxID=3555 RepID=A0A0J8AWW1_BETVV|nr:hypothetical protein BVRB_032960 [Beta vulgaris subsp. vulgaris]